MSPPFHFEPMGDDFSLDEDTTAVWNVQVDLPPGQRALVDGVIALAKANVRETGRPCDVFACDKVTLLYRARVLQ